MDNQKLKPLFTVEAVRGGFEVGAGSRYRERHRYAGRYAERYGSRYGVGQASDLPSWDPGYPGTPSVPAVLTATRPTTPPDSPPGKPPRKRGEHCVITTGPCFAGHGRAWYKEHNYDCEIKPPRCNCHVIGANTLNNANFPQGVASLAQWTVTADSGDASFFVPYYIFIQAFETGAVANLAITGVPLPTILQDSLSGREPNLRRADVNDPSFGIITTVYGQEKEIECVDWNRFASVTNQNLTLIGQNITDVSVHVFVDIWGLPAA